MEGIDTGSGMIHQSMIDPAQVRFTHNRISSKFRNGISLDETISAALALRMAVGMMGSPRKVNAKVFLKL